MRQLFRELKRRNVYRVAVTYAAVAFVTLQAARLIFPATTLEGLYDKLVVLAFVGFPIALVIAWAFELTPEGVRRTSAEEGGGEGAAEPESTPPEERRARSRLAMKALVGLGLVGAAVAGGWYLTGGGGESPGVSEQTVAVLPFQVSGSGTEEWREGMVTMLGTGLDGAAGLRAIADQTVLAAWEQADQQTEGAGSPRFLTAARRVGARYAVIGSAVKLGGELRLSADIHETPSGDRLGQIEVRGSPDSVTALADSLTRRVLGVLLEERERDLPSVDLASLTTSSLPALKSFLRGERHFRAGEYELAAEDYEAAVERDSSFAWAYARLEISRGWAGEGQTTSALRRAYELSDQLPRRERRLVRARYIEEIQGRPLAAADTLRRLTEEYPDDPSARYFLGETVFHGWIPGGWPEAERAFEEAVRLDPGIAPYHHHLVDLAMSLHHDSALAARRIAAHPGGRAKDWYRALWDLSFGSDDRRQDAWTRIDSLSLGSAFWVAWPLSHPADLDLQKRVLEALVDRDERYRLWLAITRLLAGQVAEAVSMYPEFSESLRPSFRCLLARSLAVGYPLSDSIVRSRLDPSSLIGEDASVGRLRCAGSYLIERGRGDELGPVLDRLRSLRERPDPPAGMERRVTQAVHWLAGYRAWSANDLEEAAAHWSDVGGFSPVGSILRGDLYRDLGQLTRAEDWYITGWLHPIAHERLGQLYEQMDRPEDAAAAYRRFIAAWKNADPELQDRVQAARERLQRLDGSGPETDG